VKVRLRPHQPFALLLVLFTLGVVLYQSLMPVMEGSDEVLHVNYVMRLAAGAGLPDRASRTTNPTQQASGQPPLAYAAYALWLRLLHAPVIAGETIMAHTDQVRNRWYSPHEPWNRRDNRIIFIHGPADSLFGAPDIVLASRALRLLNIAWGITAVCAAYLASAQVFRQRRWQLVATAIFALLPTMLYMFSYVNNDAPAVALSTLAIALTLRMIRIGGSPQRWFWVGMALSLATLAKVSALLIAPGIGLALLVLWRRERGPIRDLLADGLALALPLAVLFVPWALYGAVTYGDPFGFNTHRHETVGFYFDQPRSLAELLPLLPNLYLSYYGWTFFNLLSPFTYTLFGAVVALSAAGCALRLRWNRLNAVERIQALVLAVIILAMLAGMIRWMQQLSFTGARLMYPAHAAFVIALTGGLVLLSRRFPRTERPLATVVVGLCAAAGLILAPVALIDGYGPVRQVDAASLPTLSGGLVDFDGTIRLLGIRQDGARINGPRHGITACWEVLRETERPAAYSLKLIHEGEIAADRTTLFGLGHHPSGAWRVGDRFCDDVSLPIDDPDLIDEPPLRPATVYDVLAVVLDAGTLAVDWAATGPDGSPIDVPIVGRVISPAGQMQTGAVLMSVDIDVPGLARIEGYAVEGMIEAGGSPLLTLRWAVEAETDRALSQFFHLYGPDGFVTVAADGTPRGGLYPTWAWAAGERIVDTIRLQMPDDLPPGLYRIETGFYDPLTGERIPIETDGVPAANQSATLITFEIR